MRFFFSRCLGLALFVTLFPLQTFAWNAVGHMVVANIAYERLKPEVRAKVDKMTMDLAKEYPNITQFQQLAPWPDSLRSQRIETYTHWHYIDKAFSTDNTPLKDLNDSDNVVWALKQIIPVVGNNAVNPYERARFLAFLVHMTGDIHQPLHTTSRISAQHPNGDQGGNQFTVLAKGNHLRGNNLHSLWDGGVGVVDVDSTKENIEAVTRSITKHYPESYFGDKIHDLKPEDWANEGFEVATKVVYNTPENQAPNTNYIETGKQTAEQRLALAGYRLAELLNQALDKK
jgi:hypothetical protein